METSSIASRCSKNDARASRITLVPCESFLTSLRKGFCRMTSHKAIASLLGLSFLPCFALAQSPAPASVFGYSNFAAEGKTESAFLAIPNAKLAGEELKTLTAEPHLAGTPEDNKTAEYVAEKF